MSKTVMGHIDCPHCGTSKGMRITHDKNGAPFGYCEAQCSGQLKVGGDARRVAAFLARFPWAAGKPLPEPKPEPQAEQAPTTKAAPIKAAAQVKRSSSAGAFDALLGLAGAKQ